MKRYFAVLLFALAVVRTDPAAAVPFEWSFEVSPGGTLAGTVDDIVGWGYVLRNLDDAGHWLVADFVSPPGFSIATLDNPPFVGPIFDFPILAPGTSAEVPWDPGVVGLAEALLLSAGSEIDGINGSFEFTLTISWWTDDPLNGGVPVLNDQDEPLTDSRGVAAGLIVSAQTGAPVPEPSGVILLALGLGLLALMPRLIPHAARGGRK